MRRRSDEAQTGEHLDALCACGHSARIGVLGCTNPVPVSSERGLHLDRSSGHPLQKLSEQEMIDCAGGDAYGMKWIVHNGGIASIKDAPLANHSDKNLTGCRGITACATVERESAAYINGTTCLTNHVEENILALLQQMARGRGLY